MNLKKLKIQLITLYFLLLAALPRVNIRYFTPFLKGCPAFFAHVAVGQLLQDARFHQQGIDLSRCAARQGGKQADEDGAVWGNRCCADRDKPMALN